MNLVYKGIGLFLLLLTVIGEIQAQTPAPTWDPTNSVPEGLVSIADQKFLGVGPFKVDNGIRIDRVIPGSAAERAGLKQGEVIVRVDDQDVRGLALDDFSKLIASKDQHALKILAASGVSRTVQVTLTTIDQQDWSRPTNVKIGQVPPDVEALTAPGGKVVKLSDLLGHVVVVIFTASWCGACQAEAPTIHDLYEKYKDRGVEFLSVYRDDKKLDVFKFAKGNGVEWPISIDGNGWENATALAYGVGGVPTHVVVGKDGKVLQPDVKGDDLSAVLDNALK